MLQEFAGSYFLRFCSELIWSSWDISCFKRQSWRIFFCCRVLTDFISLLPEIPLWNGSSIVYIVWESVCLIMHKHMRNTWATFKKLPYLYDIVQNSAEGPMSNTVMLVECYAACIFLQWLSSWGDYFSGWMLPWQNYFQFWVKFIPNVDLHESFLKSKCSQCHLAC